jgi:RNA polymerase sigma-70 factor (ECF subfamily)
VTENDPLESSWSLLQRARAGDDGAVDRLVAHYRPILMRWAHGRLPAQARGLHETEDIVQVALVRALARLREFEPRHEGAFLGYLRTTVVNEIRQAIRAAGRRPTSAPLDERLADVASTPLENAMKSELLDRYETALDGLKLEQREAVVLWLEFRFSHEDIAAAMGRPSANAARKLVDRGLARLAEAMRELR